MTILVKIFINGYGNIGRRLASALAADKEMQLVGVAKYSIDEKVKEALENHYDVYVPSEEIRSFKEQGYNVTGSIE
ncbi:MAG: type II glyceraldehyde-3-phosphate dehydrogenase, partial [Thermoproteota archaeon]|nr:type II glyceraldehyde-3-phosphate dehydrogenase [Thermoproteota archaeon]